LSGAFCLTARAEVHLSKVFTPHMVLQREMAVPIWGTADPGENVEVTFRNQTKSVKADAQGKWRVQLDSLKAGGPDVLKVGTVAIEDVLVGEVWVGSGQSNMDMMVKSYTAGDPTLEKLAAGSYPKLRLLRKDAGAKWQESTRRRIRSFPRCFSPLDNRSKQNSMYPSG